jgi:hypothetical protein
VRGRRGQGAGEGTGLASLAQARERWLATLETILARADGSIRADATGPEITTLFGGVCRVLASRGEADSAVWRRHAELVADAFRPCAHQVSSTSGARITAHG